MILSPAQEQALLAEFGGSAILYAPRPKVIEIATSLEVAAPLEDIPYVVMADGSPSIPILDEPEKIIAERQAFRFMFAWRLEMLPKIFEIGLDAWRLSFAERISAGGVGSEWCGHERKRIEKYGRELLELFSDFIALGFDAAGQFQFRDRDADVIQEATNAF
jgi:hypothetical protein